MAVRFLAREFGTEIPNCLWHAKYLRPDLGGHLSLSCALRNGHAVTGGSTHGGEMAPGVRRMTADDAVLSPFQSMPRPDDFARPPLATTGFLRGDRSRRRAETVTQAKCGEMGSSTTSHCPPSSTRAALARCARLFEPPATSRLTTTDPVDGRLFRRPMCSARRYVNQRSRGRRWDKRSSTTIAMRPLPLRLDAVPHDARCGHASHGFRQIGSSSLCRGGFGGKAGIYRQVVVARRQDVAATFCVVDAQRKCSPSQAGSDPVSPAAARRTFTGASSPDRRGRRLPASLFLLPEPAVPRPYRSVHPVRPASLRHHPTPMGVRGAGHLRPRRCRAIVDQPSSNWVDPIEFAAQPSGLRHLPVHHLTWLLLLGRYSTPLDARRRSAVTTICAGSKRTAAIGDQIWAWFSTYVESPQAGAPASTAPFGSKRWIRHDHAGTSPRDRPFRPRSR